jgi:hypothetical protein
VFRTYKKAVSTTQTCGLMRAHVVEVICPVPSASDNWALQKVPLVLTEVFEVSIRAQAARTARRVYSGDLCLDILQTDNAGKHRVLSAAILYQTHGSSNNSNSSHSLRNTNIQ